MGRIGWTKGANKEIQLSFVQRQQQPRSKQIRTITTRTQTHTYPYTKIRIYMDMVCMRDMERHRDGRPNDHGDNSMVLTSIHSSARRGNPIIHPKDRDPNPLINANCLSLFLSFSFSPPIIVIPAVLFFVLRISFSFIYTVMSILTAVFCT